MSDMGRTMPCFAEAAGRLAGFAGAVLGWSAAAFWASTPAELAGVAAALRGDDAQGTPPDAALMARMREAFPDG